VATQVIVEVDGRRQRVKVPNEHAGRVRQEVQSAVFEYHDVSSLGGLRAEVREEEDEETEGETDAGEQDAETEPGSMVDSDWSPPADQDVTSPSESKASSGGTESITESGSERDIDGAAGATAADVDALTEQVEELTETVERQSELIEAQQETLEKLVDELRRGR
ncbi:MAG: hypothetical protein ACI8U4_003243, partial [Natronomonas sp.]